MEGTAIIERRIDKQTCLFPDENPRGSIGRAQTNPARLLSVAMTKELKDAFGVNFSVSVERSGEIRTVTIRYNDGPHHRKVRQFARRRLQTTLTTVQQQELARAAIEIEIRRELTPNAVLLEILEVQMQTGATHPQDRVADPYLRHPDGLATINEIAISNLRGRTIQPPKPRPL